MQAAKRLQNLPPYPFARWAQHLTAAREKGLDLIRMDMGNPDLPPPAAVIDALCQSTQRPDQHGYAGYRGQLALRQATADYYQARFGVELDPDRQIVTLLGSKEGIINLALAWLDPGDLALVPELGYAPYTMGTMMAGAEVHYFRLPAERGFIPDLENIPAAVAERAKMIWLNYPNNPTGATAELDFLARAVDFARRYDLLLCHDAPYCDVAFDGYQAPSILQVPGAAEVAIEFNSLSKSWNMAGWRVGMAVGNPQALSALAQTKSNMDSGIFLPVQAAAVQALKTSPDWLQERNQVYQQRMNTLVTGLKAVGIHVPSPQATLYAWVPVPTEQSSEAFSLDLLMETGIVFTPGNFFGPAGEGYLRIAITTPAERIQEAMQRLARFMA